MRTPNQQMRTLNQQMRTPNQQMRTPNQQMRSPNQQMRSPNQHLKGETRTSNSLSFISYGVYTSWITPLNPPLEMGETRFLVPSPLQGEG